MTRRLIKLVAVASRLDSRPLTRHVRNSVFSDHREPSYNQSGAIARRFCYPLIIDFQSRGWKRVFLQNQFHRSSPPPRPPRLASRFIYFIVRQRFTGTMNLLAYFRLALSNVVSCKYHWQIQARNAAFSNAVLVAFFTRVSTVYPPTKSRYSRISLLLPFFLPLYIRRYIYIFYTRQISLEFDSTRSNLFSFSLAKSRDIFLRDSSIQLNEIWSRFKSLPRKIYTKYK